MWKVIVNHFTVRQDMKKIRERSNQMMKTRMMLGRWKITYEPKTIQSKVDWANVDHCGCCDIDYFHKIKNK